MTDERPDLIRVSSGEELRRWYWLKSELMVLARRLRVPAGGSKQALTDRLAATLDGAIAPIQPANRIAAGQLCGPLTAATIIPVGQRCSQPVRAFLTAQVGPAFRFDGPMRAYFAAADGTTTLAHAVAHWHSTRHRPPAEIGPQFELNRFTRAWHRDHPGGQRAELMTAWRQYRDQPADQRRRPDLNTDVRQQAF